MTLLVLATNLMGAADVPVTVWSDFREVQQTGKVTVPQVATYHVWLWLSADATVRLRRTDLKVAANRTDKDPEFVWRNAGTVDLPAGDVAVTLPPGVATIALSTAADFDPVAAMPHRRVLNQPGRVEDRRVDRIRETNTVFTMPEFNSRESWEAYADRLRQRILLSSGLYPMPDRTPLNAHVFDRVTHDDYTVEKVSFEAWPGFYVTGNLYRPIGAGPFPAIVGPHGHWEKGRFENGERGSVPGRHITFARMGIVAFSYDMIGYNDSKQFKHVWGGKKEKLWGIHPYAMQLWSAIRAVDFLSELPDVDPERIAATGASGGGTQTFSLMAVDPRIKVAAPVNMISSTMQGGCPCENAPLLRLNNSNMEIGALMAPKPLLMVSATGDWTRETPRVEYPAIRSIYALYGADDRVKNVHIDAGHNYNQASREAVYEFFGKFVLNDEAKYRGFKEPAFTVDDESALHVFPDALPAGAATSDEIIATVIGLEQQRLQAGYPNDAAGLAQFRETYNGVLAQVMGAEVPEPGTLTLERTGKTEGSTYWTEQWILHRPRVDDAVPAILYRASSPDRQNATLIVREGGKAPALTLGGPVLPEVDAALAQDRAVLIVDVYLQGEHHSPLHTTEQVVEGGFADTFQPTLTANQVQDVLTALSFLRSRRDLTGDIAVVGLGRAGLLTLFAAAIDGGVESVSADLNHFDVNDDEAWVAQYYVPSLRSVGDAATAGILLAPIPLRLTNIDPSFPVDTVRNAYRAAGADDRLTVETAVAATARP